MKPFRSPLFQAATWESRSRRTVSAPESPPAEFLEEITNKEKIAMPKYLKGILESTVSSFSVRREARMASSDNPSLSLCRARRTNLGRQLGPECQTKLVRFADLWRELFSPPGSFPHIQARQQ